ncbi:hypothetical protein HOC_10794 [Hyphomonas oceanitis SCH89]|uniref:Uncharacterized protein n=1 Tax=Hyphomonas oceanitis SCH89 TaxID=1280953 RepID=A0A059G6M2_9PROT|nr:hypothetical protein HOC_10794 [Hyphomonas oceanitis SCH89]
MVRHSAMKARRVKASGRGAAESAPRVIIATERGVAMTPELLSLQGTSKIWAISGVSLARE